MNVIAKQPFFKKMFEESLSVNNTFNELHGPGWGRRFRRCRVIGIKYLIFHVISKLGFSVNTNMKTFWGREAFLPLGDVDTQFWYFYGLLTPQEHNLVAYFINTFKEDDIFYDIGANYGFYTYLMSDMAIRGEIHTFEPNTKVFPYLEKNCKPSKNIKLNNVAMSSTDGKIQFFNLFEAKASGMSTLIQNVADKRSIDYSVNTVESITLTQYLSTNKPPTVLKIDVEGAEELVLKGGSEFFGTSAPTIAMEVWFGKNATNDPLPAINFLYTLGYSSYRINTKGKISQITILSADSIEGEFENIIFKK